MSDIERSHLSPEQISFQEEAQGRLFRRWQETSDLVAGRKAETKKYLAQIAKLPANRPDLSLEKWADDMYEALRRGLGEGDNYVYTPNYEILSTAFKRVAALAGNTHKLGDLFDFSQHPPQLRPNYQVKNLRLKLKTAPQVRSDQLAETFKAIRKAHLMHPQVIKRWIEDVKPTLSYYTYHRDQWEKISDFLQEMEKSGFKSILDKKGQVSELCKPRQLAVTLGLDYEPAEHSKSGCQVMSLGEHHRIGRRQAAMRELETYGDARNGGLLLA